MLGEGRSLTKCGLALTVSSSSGIGASLLGTGVSLEFGASETSFLLGAFLGLVLSGSFNEFAVDGVFEKKEEMLFCPDPEPDFFNVAGVDVTGVADFLAIFSPFSTQSKSHSRHYYCQTV